MFTNEWKRAKMKEITAVREKNGVSQRALSKASRVKQATISRLECEKQMPQVETLYKLAEALNHELELK